MLTEVPFEAEFSEFYGSFFAPETDLLGDYLGCIGPEAEDICVY